MTRLTTLLAGALCALTLAACGSDDGGGGSTPSGSASKAESGAFPVTLEHKYGSTTIEQAPKRVAVVGLREQDDLLALGVVPVAATRYSTEKVAIYPWAKDELGDAKSPVVLDSTDGIQVEKVAATRPDLIIGRFSGMTKSEYQQLSKIAPTVAQPKGVADYGEPWQAETEAVGQAVGQPDKAKELVQESEDRIAAARKSAPELEGKTAAVVAPYQGVFVYGPDDPRPRLLNDLGMMTPDGLGKAIGDRFGGSISDERLDLIDVDALVVLGDDAGLATLRKNKLFARLGAAKKPVLIPPDDVLYNATSAVTVLNIETILKSYVPKLKEAVKTSG